MLTRKSSLSSTSLPPIRCRSLQILYPNTQGMLAISTITPLISTAFFLSTLYISRLKEIRFSKTAITVEKLANVINRKNKDPQILSPAIFTKILGRVTKIRDGSGIRLYAERKTSRKNDQSGHKCHKSIQCPDPNSFSGKRILPVHIASKNLHSCDAKA